MTVPLGHCTSFEEEAGAPRTENRWRKMQGMWTGASVDL
jgi:hypothetical protein